MGRKVSVIGLGYIGLPTAAILSQNGYEVIGVDINEKVVESVNRGRAHIVEKDLDSALSHAIDSKSLKASTVVEKSDIFIISVPTPFKDGYKPDLSYINTATEFIAPHLEKGNLIILESTVPVGATEQIVKWLKELRHDLKLPDAQIKSNEPDVYIAHCPERVLPGNVLHELIYNDRTIGGITSSCTYKARDFYNTFVRGKCNLTDAKTAELSKLVENSFRDINIAFANEISLICDELEIDPWKLIEIANYHPRVDILSPGPGVGGHCIAVDPWFIVDSAPENSKIIKIAREINDSKPSYVIAKVQEKIRDLSVDNSEIKILTLGLTFKPDIDDLRESPALEIAKSINNICSGEHLIVEPNIKELPQELVNRNCRLVSLKEGLKLANIVLLLVHHKEFLDIDPKLLQNKQVIDTRGVLKIANE